MCIDVYTGMCTGCVFGTPAARQGVHLALDSSALVLARNQAVVSHERAAERREPGEPTAARRGRVVVELGKAQDVAWRRRGPRIVDGLDDVVIDVVGQLVNDRHLDRRGRPGAITCP